MDIRLRRIYVDETERSDVDLYEIDHGESEFHVFGQMCQPAVGNDETERSDVDRNERFEIDTLPFF